MLNFGARIHVPLICKPCPSPRKAQGTRRILQSTTPERPLEALQISEALSRTSPYNPRPFSNQPLKLVQIDPNSETPLSERFWVKLEICSPDSFSVTPLAVQGFANPAVEDCLQSLSDCLPNVSGFLFKRHACEEKENERKMQNFYGFCKSLVFLL